MGKVQQDIPKPSIRTVILNIVNSHSGINSVNLVLEIMSLIITDRIDYISEIEKLVKEKEIVELEYIVPQLNYRIKSIYFPKGTLIGAEIQNRGNK